MRQAFLYYLVQTLSADPHRQVRPDAPAEPSAPAGPARGKETSSAVVRG